MEVLSFINKKGGVGKTTLAYHTAQALALCGQKVLCIDLDNQHSLTNRFGLAIGNTTIRDLFCGTYADYNQFLSQAVVESTVNNLHFIASELKLCNEDVTDLNLLADFLHNSILSEYYDIVCIDNHPSIEQLQIASIVASTKLVVPVQLKQQALEGLAETISILENNCNVPADSIVVIPNIAEGLKIQVQMFEVLQAIAGDYVADTVIPLDRVIEEVEMKNKSLFLDRLGSSKSAMYFAAFVVELFPHIAKDYEVAMKMIDTERKAHRSEVARQIAKVNFSKGAKS